MGQLQIIRPPGVAAQVGQRGKRGHGDEGHAYRQAIQTVRQIHRVRKTQQDDDDKEQVKKRADETYARRRRHRGGLKEGYADIPRIIAREILRQDKQHRPNTDGHQ